MDISHTDPIGRRLWIGIQGTQLDAKTRRHLAAIRPGGIVLFGRNIESAEQVKHLCEELRNVLGGQLFIAIDHEGGAVVRTTQALTVFPGNAALGAIAAQDLEQATRLCEQQSQVVAAELCALGIDVNLAPVVDVAPRQQLYSLLGTRSFGGSPQHVVALARATLRGFAAGGLISCLKHFPGLGAADLDPHFELPRIDRAVDMKPQRRVFAHLIGKHSPPMIMSSHFCCEPDPEKPVTFSAVICQQMLRKELQYPGVLISDALEMGALSSRESFASIVIKTAGAGHDILCICSGYEKQQIARDALLEWAEKPGNPIGDVQQVESRLLKLERCRGGKPLSSSKSSSAQLALEIARQSLQIDDPQQLVPLDKSLKALLIYPQINKNESSDICDPLRGEPLATLVELLVDSADSISYKSVPTSEDFVSLAVTAVNYPLVILVISGLSGCQARQQLLRQIFEWSGQVVLIFIGDSREAKQVPAKFKPATLCSHGGRAVQQRAIAEVLLGGNH